MTEFLEEKIFSQVFEVFGTSFKQKMETRNWDFLFYNEESFYVPSLVEEFYNSLDVRGINHENDSIVISWRGGSRVIDPNYISALTGIQRQPGAPNPMTVEEYMPLMGDHCEKPTCGGIKGTTMYKNIYATCRWISANVLGISQTSSFYEKALHIVHCLMVNNFNVCMCTQLIQSIGNAKIRQHAHPTMKLPLPVLITTICNTFIDGNEFAALEPYRIFLSPERITTGYRQCQQINWFPRLQQENVPATDMPNMDDTTFWNQEDPVDQDTVNQFTVQALRRLHRQMANMEIGQGSSSRTRRRRGRDQD